MAAQTVFLSLLSAALIGLGFVSSSGHLIKPYLGAVLPTLVITGLLTFARLVHGGELAESQTHPAGR